MDELELRYLAGCAVAREAGRLARRYFERRDLLQVERKGAQDHVSMADRAVEDLVVATLGSAFPDDRFLGEERGGTTAERLWVIDPIDGTTNYLRGFPIYCVSIAYLVDQVPTLGFIYDPTADDLFAARRGHGATCNGARLAVSGCTDIADAVVGVGFSYRRSVDIFSATIGRLLSADCEFRRPGSGALCLAQVAAGRLDGYWEQHTNSWDAGAGLLLVQEAGGWASDFFAGDGIMSGNPVLACTPALRPSLEKLCDMANLT